jgi:16S rRNA (adenine1518-N6/adenine1519-N6)-dimethyltransferase
MNHHSLSPKKSLGQHFLHDQNVIERIAEAVIQNVKDPSEAIILEVGPGTGVLTNALLERGLTVVAFEIDQRMVQHLSETLCVEFQKLTVHHTDFLKVNNEELVSLASRSRSAELQSARPPQLEVDRPPQLEADKPQELHLVGNLPYYATSQILFKTLDIRTHLSSATFMIQKEVAERIVAVPSTKEYGILSVQTQLMSDPKILFDVKPGSFTPPPKVMSSVIRLLFTQPALLCQDSTLKTIVRTAFQQRRKKLSNALKSLANAEEYPDFDFTLRPEAWEPRMYERMAESFEQNVNSSPS